MNSKVTPVLSPETPAGAAHWQFPPAQRELICAVHRGQSPRSQSKVEKVLERATGRIQHHCDLPQDTQSNGRRLTQEQVNLSTHCN